MKSKRLLKLADFLDKLPRKKFYFGGCILERDANFCGTICCAIGWTPKVFPRLVKWDDERLSSSGYVDIAMELFGLSESQADKLFTPGHGEPSKILHVDATPKQMAGSIRRFVKDNTPEHG